MAAVFTVFFAVPAAGATDGPGAEECYTIQLLGYEDLIVAPVLDDAVGVVLGTTVTERGLGATLLVRPQACTGLSVANPSVSTIVRVAGSAAFPMVP